MSCLIFLIKLVFQLLWMVKEEFKERLRKFQLFTLIGFIILGSPIVVPLFVSAVRRESVGLYILASINAITFIALGLWYRRIDKGLTDVPMPKSKKRWAIMLVISTIYLFPYGLLVLVADFGKYILQILSVYFPNIYPNFSHIIGFDAQNWSLSFIFYNFMDYYEYTDWVQHVPTICTILYIVAVISLIVAIILFVYGRKLRKLEKEYEAEYFPVNKTVSLVNSTLFKLVVLLDLSMLLYAGGTALRTAVFENGVLSVQIFAVIIVALILLTVFYLVFNIMKFIRGKGKYV